MTPARVGTAALVSIATNAETAPLVGATLLHAIETTEQGVCRHRRSSRSASDIARRPTYERHHA